MQIRESYSQAIVQKWGFCMKLKYYLRGLGIGIVVTVLLMGVSSSKEAKAETTQVAAVEKMTEETETAETTVEESNAAETITAKEAKTSETETQEETKNTEDAEQAEEVSTIITEEETMASVEIADGAAESYLLNIVKGDDSGTVARKLQNAGLVENATEFDAFLMQHGYDKKISVGVVEIPLNATWMEIAQKLSGSAE